MPIAEGLWDNAKTFLEMLAKAHSDLTAYRNQLSWRSKQRSVDGARQKGYAGSSWETRTLSASWDPTRGDTWFRCRLVVPKRVSAVALTVLGNSDPFNDVLWHEGATYVL